MLRAERRHHRDRALARRQRILLGFSPRYREYLGDHRIMHWHLKCGCFMCSEERTARRRQEERIWRTEASTELHG